jgi:hypothetical protein
MPIPPSFTFSRSLVWVYDSAGVSSFYFFFFRAGLVPFIFLLPRTLPPQVLIEREPLKTPSLYCPLTHRGTSRRSSNELLAIRTTTTIPGRDWLCLLRIYEQRHQFQASPFKNKFVYIFFLMQNLWGHTHHEDLARFDVLFRFLLSRKKCRVYLFLIYLRVFIVYSSFLKGKVS